MRNLSFVLLLLLLLAQACDKVKDTPEPDYFQAFEPQKIQVSTEPGESQVWVNILDYNQIKAEYRLEMGEPHHGTLSTGVVPGGFLYTSNPGFYGIDSVTYRVCLGSVCKSGAIYFHIIAPNCPVKAKNDDYQLILSDVLELPVLGNDSSLCAPASIRSLVYSGPGTAQIVGDSIHVRLPEFYEGEIQLTYTIGNSFGTSSAQVRARVSIDEAYCAARFIPVSDTLTIVNPLQFKTFIPSDLYHNDTRCHSILNLSSFEILNTPSNPVYELKYQSNRYWFLVKDSSSFTQGTFQYRLCTNSGICRTANVVIRKP